PRAGTPGHSHQQTGTEPADPPTMDLPRPFGADRVAKPTLVGDPPAPPSLQGLVHQDEQRLVGGQGGAHQQAQEEAAQGEGGPAIAVEEAMEGGEPGRGGATTGGESRTHRATTGR